MSELNIENLKCCGNCRHCDIDGEYINDDSEKHFMEWITCLQDGRKKVNAPWAVCEKWEFDSQSVADRMPEPDEK